jgi:hypothetical protein
MDPKSPGWFDRMFFIRDVSLRIFVSGISIVVGIVSERAVASRWNGSWFFGQYVPVRELLRGVLAVGVSVSMYMLIAFICNIVGAPPGGRKGPRHGSSS